MDVPMQWIAISWSSGISEAEATLAVQTVGEILLRVLEHWNAGVHVTHVPEIKAFGYWVLQGAHPDQPYNSLQWYIDRSLDPRRQELHAQRWLQLVLNEPWQQQTPHYDLALLHYPLFDEERGQQVFGFALRGRVAAISVFPLRSLGPEPRRALVLRRQVAHYVGHAFGIPVPRGRGREGCTNVCAMRPAYTMAEWVKWAQEEAKVQTLYCQDCQRALAARLAGQHFGLN
jgi:predicted Zn-dependent protease